MAASLEVGGWRAELDGLLARFGRLFVRAEPREQAGRYLEGLLGPVERKNGWQLAEHLGDARPWRTQRVLSHVLWDEEAARDLCREHAVERLGAEDAVLVVDETGFVKKGRHSAGVARQSGRTHEISCLKVALKRGAKTYRGRGSRARFISSNCIRSARLFALSSLTAPCALVGVISCVRPGAAVLRHRGQGRELPGRGLPGVRHGQGACPDRPGVVPAQGVGRRPGAV